MFYSKEQQLKREGVRTEAGPGGHRHGDAALVPDRCYTMLCYTTTRLDCTVLYYASVPSAACLGERDLHTHAHACVCTYTHKDTRIERVL